MANLRTDNLCGKGSVSFYDGRVWSNLISGSTLSGYPATNGFKGNTANDVAQAFWKILDKYNIKKESRTGYSIGIGYPPDWGEHTLNIYKGDMTVLEPNVCFHMIAVMQFGDWGVEASEAIRVTENGSELFCNFPKELHIKS